MICLSARISYPQLSIYLHSRLFWYYNMLIDDPLLTLPLLALGIDARSAENSRRIKRKRKALAIVPGVPEHLLPPLVYPLRYVPQSQSPSGNERALVVSSGIPIEVCSTIAESIPLMNTQWKFDTCATTHMCDYFENIPHIMPLWLWEVIPHWSRKEEV